MKTLAKRAGAATVYLVLAFLMLGLLGCSEAGPVGVELEGESLEVQQDAVVPLGKKPLEGPFVGWFVPEPGGMWTVNGVEYYGPGANLGTGKPFEEVIRGKAWFFEEELKLYNPAGELVLILHYNGVMRQLSKLVWVWTINGVVEEAYGEFAMWVGRKVHGDGIVEFTPDGIPYSTGTLRLN